MRPRSNTFCFCSISSSLQRYHASKSDSSDERESHGNAVCQCVPSFVVQAAHQDPLDELEVALSEGCVSHLLRDVFACDHIRKVNTELKAISSKSVWPDCLANAFLWCLQNQPRSSECVHRSCQCMQRRLLICVYQLSSSVRNWHEWEPPTPCPNLLQVSFAFVDLVNQPGKASLASVAEQWLLHTTSSTSLWLASCEVVTSHHLQMAACDAKAANLDT